VRARIKIYRVIYNFSSSTDFKDGLKEKSHFIYWIVKHEMFKIIFKILMVFSQT